MDMIGKKAKNCAELLAPAKINLTLEVLGKRDDGYHELRSIMHSVSVYDRITIEPNGTEKISVFAAFRFPRGILQELPQNSSERIPAVRALISALKKLSHLKREWAVRAQMPQACFAAWSSFSAGFRKPSCTQSEKSRCGRTLLPSRRLRARRRHRRKADEA